MKPIAFKPVTVDFKLDLQKRLEKAPDEHAAALLAAYDILEAAYDQGLLDIVRGMIASKDTIITTLAHFARQPEGVVGIRNLLTAAKILCELNPKCSITPRKPCPQPPRSINVNRLRRASGIFFSAPTARTVAADCPSSRCSSPASAGR